MNICHLDIWTEHLPLKRPYTIAFKRVDRVDLHFVQLVTDTGLTGLGCAAPTDVTHETAAGCLTALEAGAARLRGQDPRRLRALTRALADAVPNHSSARAALDMALHDVNARIMGLPLAAMLGQCHDRLPTSITVGISGADATLEEAQEYVARGFHCLKVKLGLDIDEDLERLRALRSEFGSDVTMRVDANQGYAAQDVMRLFEHVETLKLEFIEQPLPAHAVDTMRALPASMRALMAADESLHTPADAVALCEGRPFGLFNIKLMKCGGVTGGLAIADIAESAGLKLMWGCMDESVISIAAALHAAFACPATRYLDLDGSLDLSRDVAAGGFRLDGGWMSLTDRPGLGVRLLESRMARAGV